MFARSPKELAIFAVSQRKLLGLSQTEVAERVGLKQKTVSAFENTPEKVRLTTAFLILSALSLEVHIISKDKKISSQWKEEW